jgi:hypothetical protein
MMWEEYCGFRQGFSDAMDHRFYTIHYLDNLVRTGMAQFLCTQVSAIIFEVRLYPTGKKAVHGLYATGDLDEIAGVLIPRAEAWGKQMGCEFAFVDSREGWQRILEPAGFDTYKVALIKEL